MEDDCTNESDNPIGELQELCQKRLLPPPKYNTSDYVSSLNGKFECTVILGSHTEKATGKSKKAAKHEAAARMLQRLKNQPSKVFPTRDKSPSPDPNVLSPTNGGSKPKRPEIEMPSASLSSVNVCVIVLPPFKKGTGWDDVTNGTFSDGEEGQSVKERGYKKRNTSRERVEERKKERRRSTSRSRELVEERNRGKERRRSTSRSRGLVEERNMGKERSRGQVEERNGERERQRSRERSRQRGNERGRERVREKLGEREWERRDKRYDAKGRKKARRMRERECESGVEIYDARQRKRARRVREREGEESSEEDYNQQSALKQILFSKFSIFSKRQLFNS